MTRLRTIPTADLSGRARSATRRLLDLAFAGDFDDDDWDHALGGLHVLVLDGETPVAHAAVVQRQLLHNGRAWRCGYVEAVAVHPERRGRGFAAAVMTEAERIVDHGHDFGALSASASGRGLYVSRGWLPWQGPTFVLGPDGPERTEEDDDSTFVRLVKDGAELRPTEPITCDWRNGDVW